MGKIFSNALVGGISVCGIMSYFKLVLGKILTFSQFSSINMHIYTSVLEEEISAGGI